MAECRFLAYHGWGFDSTCWQPWQKSLMEYGEFDLYDRGYFGNPLKPGIKKNERNLIVFTHSFGLHWCREEIIRNADMLVIFGGFLKFHPQAAQFKRRSRLILQQMINDFEVHPEKVLKNFYRNCYAPKEHPELEIEDLNHDLMLEDLNRLHDSELDIDLLRQSGKLCILHGADDYIVPKTKGREIYNHLQHMSQYFEIKMGGHALPFSHREQLFEFLKPHLEQFLDTR